MSANRPPASQADKVLFVRSALDSAEKRRDAVENKASILIASNAIVLSGLGGLIPAIALSVQLTGSSGLAAWIPVGTGILTLVAAIVSIINSARILASFSTDKARRQTMDIGETEVNLFFFRKIAEVSKADYLAGIEALDDQKILEQLVSDLHNLSRILRARYRILYFSHGAFIISVIFFGFTAIGKMLGM